MASLDGISYKSKLSFPEYPSYDLIMCAKFSDIYGFFSLRELSLDRYGIKDTGFVYDFSNDISFSKKNLEKLLNENNFIQIDKKIKNKKKNLQELFKLTADNLISDNSEENNNESITDKVILDKNIKNIFKNTKGTELMYMLQNYENIGNFLTKSTIKKINKKSSKDNVFIFRSVIHNKNRTIGCLYHSIYTEEEKEIEKCKNAKDICKEKKCKETRKEADFCEVKSFIHPEDMKELRFFLNIEEEEELFLRHQDLPRFCSEELLKDLMSQKGLKEIDSGEICFDIEKINKEIKEPKKQKENTFDYYTEEESEEESEEKRTPKDKRKKESVEKEKYALYQNIIVGNNNKILDLNVNVFNNYVNPKNKKCAIKNFKRDDYLKGKFKDGIYETLCVEDIKILNNREIEYFQYTIKNDDSENFIGRKKYDLVNWYKKNRYYPRHGGNFLVLRNGILKPQFLLGNTIDYNIFILAFQNTLTEKCVLSDQKNNFSFFLLQSLIYYIKITFKYIYNSDKTFNKYLNTLTKFILDKNSKNYYYEYLEKLMIMITGEKDPMKYIISFLSMNQVLLRKATKKILIPIQVVTSFVLCEINDSCDDIIEKDNTFKIPILDEDISVIITNEGNPYFYWGEKDKANKKEIPIHKAKGNDINDLELLDPSKY